MNKIVKKKVNFINSSQNEGLSPSCIALSFDGFGSISWHSIWFFRLFTIFFLISNFFGLSTTEETCVVEMRIWCIKIGIVLVLHFNPWVEASAGGLKSPRVSTAQ
jgi:cbb3-type cytochrome oxidase subunit 1